MKIKAKISKMSGERKHVEIPKPVRDNFQVGEEVQIEKIKGGNQDGNKNR